MVGHQQQVSAQSLRARFDQASFLFFFNITDQQRTALNACDAQDATHGIGFVLNFIVTKLWMQNLKIHTIPLPMLASHTTLCWAQLLQHVPIFH